MTSEERKELAERIKWDMIELMSEMNSPLVTKSLMGLMDAIDLHVQRMEDLLPDAA